MGRKLNIEELKAEYPELWEEVQRTVKIPLELKEKYFVGLIKAKELEEKLKKKRKMLEKLKKGWTQKDRTRAKILGFDAIVKLLILKGRKDILEEISKLTITAKKGREEINYTPLIVEEMKKIWQRLKEEKEKGKKPDIPY